MFRCCCSLLLFSISFFSCVSSVISVSIYLHLLSSSLLKSDFSFYSNLAQLWSVANAHRHTDTPKHETYRYWKIETIRIVYYVSAHIYFMLLAHFVCSTHAFLIVWLANDFFVRLLCVIVLAHFRTYPHRYPIHRSQMATNQAILFSMGAYALRHVTNQYNGQSTRAKHMALIMIWHNKKEILSYL